MKVGVFFRTDQKMGGVYQYSLSVVNCLKKNKNIDELIIYSNSNNLKFNNVRTIRIKNFNLKIIFSLLFGMFNFFPRFLFNEVDLIFAPSYSPLLFLSKAKVVFTLHDLQELYFPENFDKRTLFWRNFIYKKMAKKSSQIITESKFVKEDIVKFLNYNEKKIHVIESPPYFDSIYNDIETGENFLRYFSYRGDYIFFPAQFWKHKNHERVLKAFVKISEDNHYIKIILTGNKDREYESILSLVKSLGIEKKVIFMHLVPQKFMPFLFENALFTIAPTLHESISIPVFEAFKFGSPVCASGILGIKDQVGDSGLLFDPKSIESIYSCMNKLSKNKRLREDLIVKGKKRVEYFSIKRFNKLITDVFYDKTY